LRVLKKYWKWGVFAIIACVALYFLLFSGSSLDRDFASGNGRLEATEIMISAKTGGRIAAVLADEGDFVKKGQTLLRMDTRTYAAQLELAKSHLLQAEEKRRSALAQVEVRKCDVTSAEASIRQKESVLKAMKLRYDRAVRLVKTRAVSEQDRDTAEMYFEASRAELDHCRSALLQAKSAVRTAEVEVTAAEAGIKAAQADIDRIEVDLKDCEVIAPRTGRIQYRMAQEGEVISSGGRVLNLVDLADVYMTFFLPENMAGKIRIGDEARLLLDAMPDMPIPAKISYIASNAQFTPKTVETRNEREKLMFRVKAKIDPAWGANHGALIKPGIPGVAYVRLTGTKPWPDFLKLQTERGK